MTKKMRVALAGGLLAVILLAAAGCQQPGSQIIACFTADPTIGYAPLEVTFDASCSYVPVEEASVYEFAWSFDDGSGDVGRTVIHTFAEPGTYQVYDHMHDLGIQVGQSATRVITVLPVP
jgi:hypothetical protein